LALVGSMRKTLHLANNTFEILAKDDRVLQFRDIPAAVGFLQRFSKNPAIMSTLRNLISGRLQNTVRLSDEDVLQQIGALLLRGEIRILRSERPGGTSVETDGEEEKKGSQTQAAAPKKSWIEINLRDMEGKPVPGKRFRIRMPDASIQEGILDEFGHAEYYNINAGTCQVSFPDYDAEAWERAPS
jgi:hypothetical protein